MRLPAEVFPPGGYIAEEVAERGWTSEHVCKRLGISEREYVELIAGRMRLDARLACLCGALFGVDPVFFANLEMAWKRNGRKSIGTTEGQKDS